MDSAAGGEPWASFPEGARRALQPGSLGRNCASEKVGLSEDYIWYRRKLFSWRVALVGRTSQKKRRSECEGEIGLYYFKGQAGQLDRGWATGEGTAGKNK